MIELFSETLSNLPYQRKGFFLYENQSWEKAFIFFWKKYNQGKLIGVAHSTIRYWDLRYFSSRKTESKILINSIPEADFLAVNGEVAKESLLLSGFSAKNLLECEATRYSSLKERSLESESYRKFIEPNLIKILMIGDYYRESTNRFLRQLEDAFAELKGNFHFTFKSHPNYVVNAETFHLKRCEFESNSLEEIIFDFDVIVSGSTTGAAVDAYIVGRPLVILLDAKELNFSPLRRFKDVIFVNSARELEGVMANKGFKKILNNKKRDFYYFNESYPKWKKILLEID